jgi:hypothetical protein
VTYTFTPEQDEAFQDLLATTGYADDSPSDDTDPDNSLAAVAERLSGVRPHDPGFEDAVNEAIAAVEANLTGEERGDAVNALQRLLLVNWGLAPEGDMAACRRAAFAIADASWVDQLRVPRGNGQRSGRWTYTPWMHVDDLADAVARLDQDPLSDDERSAVIAARAALDEAQAAMGRVDREGFDPRDPALRAASEEAAARLGDAEEALRGKGLADLRALAGEARQAVADFAETDWSLMSEATDIGRDDETAGDGAGRRANPTLWVWSEPLPSDEPVNPDMKQTSKELQDRLDEIKGHHTAPSPKMRRDRAAAMQELNDRKARDAGRLVKEDEPEVPTYEEIFKGTSNAAELGEAGLVIYDEDNPRGWAETTIDPKDAYAGQDAPLDPERVRHYVENGLDAGEDPAVAVRFGGDVFLLDGHNRAAAASILGQPLPVVLRDLDPDRDSDAISRLRGRDFEEDVDWTKEGVEDEKTAVTPRVKPDGTVVVDKDGREVLLGRVYKTDAPKATRGRGATKTVWVAERVRPGPSFARISGGHETRADALAAVLEDRSVGNVLDREGLTLAEPALPTQWASQIEALQAATEYDERRRIVGEFRRWANNERAGRTRDVLPDAPATALMDLAGADEEQWPSASAAFQREVANEPRTPARWVALADALRTLKIPGGDTPVPAALDPILDKWVQLRGSGALDKEERELLRASVIGLGERPPRTLYRGANVKQPGQSFVPGQALDFGPVSTSAAFDAAMPYAENGDDTPVLFMMTDPLHGLNVSGRAEREAGFAEEEWITAGRFYVTDSVKDDDGVWHVSVSPSLGSDPTSQRNATRRPPLDMDKLFEPPKDDERAKALREAKAAHKSYRDALRTTPLDNTVAARKRIGQLLANLRGQTTEEVLSGLLTEDQAARLDAAMAEAQEALKIVSRGAFDEAVGQIRAATRQLPDGNPWHDTAWEIHDASQTDWRRAGVFTPPPPPRLAEYLQGALDAETPAALSRALENLWRISEKEDEDYLNHGIGYEKFWVTKKLQEAVTAAANGDVSKFDVAMDGFMYVSRGLSNHWGSSDTQAKMQAVRDHGNRLMEATAHRVEEDLRERYGGLEDSRREIEAVIEEVGMFYAVRDVNNNCVLASQVYELRRRGIDVHPKRAKKGRNSTSTQRAWFNTTHPFETYVDGLKGLQGKGRYNTIVKHVKDNYAPGNRGTIRAGWKGRNYGHIWNWEVLDDGEVVFVDAQTGETIGAGRMDYWREMDWRFVTLARLDHLTLQPDIEAAVAPKEDTARITDEMREVAKTLRELKTARNTALHAFNAISTATTRGRRSGETGEAYSQAYHEYNAANQAFLNFRASVPVDALKEVGNSFPLLDPNRYTK